MAGQTELLCDDIGNAIRNRRSTCGSVEREFRKGKGSTAIIRNSYFALRIWITQVYVAVAMLG
jgi:hypothetical protein